VIYPVENITDPAFEQPGPACLSGKNRGALHSTKNLKLSETCPMTNGTVPSRISGKVDNIARFNQILETFLPGFSVQFSFPPTISKNFG